MFFRKSLAGLIIATLLLQLFPGDIFALSTGVASPENYPGKMDIKNVSGLGKNISTDFFGGAMTFAYPLSLPAGSRGMTPNLTFSYASNNTDAFSPYGYGFSLSTSRIQRSAKKGVSELYIGEEYAAFGNDLIKEAGSQNRYRSKDGGDLNLYIQSGSTWIVQTPEGKILTFGSIPTSRIADPTDSSKIYAWLIDEEKDAFGHMIRYSYIQDGGQSYISDIFYGYNANGIDPIYQVHFDYITKGASLTSYRTQFEVSTKKLLSKASLLVSGSVKHMYSFAYDNPDSTISHLVSITEEAGGITLPKTQFTYGTGQFQHMITNIDNNRGGKAGFEYTPSTGYKDNSGSLLNTSLPFMVMTLSRQVLEDTVTGIKSEESYSYSGGHYYYDSSDLWGREYVGFAQVTISDEKTKKTLYFHQSQTAGIDPLKYQDHISKKGRVYRTDIMDKVSGKILQEELVKYDSRILFGERRLVYPMQKMEIDFASDGAHRDMASTYDYDDDGNLTKETNLGLVNANLSDGTFVDITGDTTVTDRTYISNTEKNLHNFQTGEKVYGFSGELLTSSSIEYDNSGSGVILGLVTAKNKKSVLDNSVITETISYSPTGMPIERYDAMNNKTSSTYDSRDIALASSRNALDWETRFVYDYVAGKPTQTINQNNVISTTSYDGFGRVIEQRQDAGSGDIILSRTSYDDSNIPNSTTTSQYFDTAASDSKTTKSYMDGWGRTIATVSTTEKPGQYSASQIRYDDDGNSIYAGYPIFVPSNSFDTTLVLQGIMDGESYRAISPGVSYRYDALDRIISQRDARGVTTKIYFPGGETITNALDSTTESHYDGYGNLASFVEKTGGRDIVTRYSYDALGRPTLLTDAYNNIRTWNYDGFGRLASATDLHTPGDIVYGVRQYEYDLLGRVKQYTNAKNEQISYVYDPLSRMTRESSTGSGGFIRDYTYDIGVRSLGTLSRVVDSISTVDFGYDPLGRKTTETRTIGDKSYTLNYGYNPASVLTDIVYPDGGHAKYDYRNGFIEGVGYTDPNSNFTQVISDIAYAPNSTMKSIRYGNGVVKNTERDVNNNYRLTRATATAGDGTRLLDTNYSYDAVNDIASITENGIDLLKKTISYTYDPLARLTGANYSYNIAGYGRDQNKSLSYAYDDIGNITGATDVGGYSYAGTDFANPHAVTTAGDTSYSYDGAGDIVSRTSGTTSLGFTYSPYGEMLSSTKDGILTSYAYDYTRRRIMKSLLGLVEHHVIDGYEVEYESGTLVPVNNEQILVNTTGSTDSGSLITNSEITDSGATLSDSGVIDGTGTTSGSGDILTDTGTLVSSGEILTDSGITESGATLIDSGSTSSGAADTGSLLIDSGSITQSGSTDSGATSGSGEILSFSGETSSGSTDSGAYMVIAGYVASTLSGATPITLTTTLTHIYLGDEKIATFQSQIDDTPKTSDDDNLIYHISDHLNSSSLDLSSTGVILQATDYQPFGKTITYQVTNQRIKGKKGGYKNKYLFANKQQDDETDLQYFEKRYYDNHIGRFTTEDPVFWEVGFTKRPAQYFTDPQQWNTYSYVRNNPINLVDPTGEISGEGSLPMIDAATVVIGVTAYVGKEFIIPALTAVFRSLSNISSTSESPDKTTPNNSQNAQSQAGQESTGQGQTIPNSEVQAGTASPPSGGGGNKNGKDGNKGDNRGANRNTTTNKTYDQIAKEKGMTKVSNTYSSVGRQPVYKGPDGKYYSPEKTSHNTTQGWKIGTVKNNVFTRQGTVDANLKVTGK